MKGTEKRSEMKRSSLPYIFAFGIIILMKVIFAYIGYRKSMRRYVRRFRKTLIRNGVPRKEAKELGDMILVMGIGDISRIISKSDIVHQYKRI